MKANNLTGDQHTRLNRQITKDEVSSIVRGLPGGKAAGMNGIPYELWKHMAAKHAEANPATPRQTSPRGTNRTPAATADIIELLTTVYRDIEEHGVAPNSHICDGWLCPIYKKGDRREIANYRPITVLNCDYKILTKLLAVRLAECAGDMIHPNQAGFVPGRSITDQIRLTQMIQAYAELDADMEGAIVGLDQEKAYDKLSITTSSRY